MTDKYYIEIKNKLIDNEVYKKVKEYSINRHDLSTYYDVGKLLIDAQGGEERAKYGNQLIKKYSIKLTKELGKGYSERSLKDMRKFYLFQKRQHTAAQLSWSHYQVLLSLKDNNEINYYINRCVSDNLGRNKLREIIKQNEYERLPESTKLKLINKEEMSIIDLVKDPIIIKNNTNKEIISEKVLHELILNNIEKFLEQLGEGFTFVGSEYKVKLGSNYNYIDLLLFNTNYLCYVVIELKVTELKKEHVGQILLYMSYVDEYIKKDNHNKTIGIIICKENNRYVMKYCSNNKIKVTKYIVI